ncbi:hypothetical protein CAPTEDRAFT_125496 [Capitella teleta]|uniref:Methyltransferase-like protein 17, mitochondrial n=1 Tax=Capitella teleta TaxID=283909 RepID=R7U5L4_CAPTE|nr:hypothetical protein CAPTEDRAFT_125496 [Capitella teleta]|eukprot:ELT98981.1 hypothetical protein CAPTEDRAFT_125496 [Capitella teleta]
MKVNHAIELEKHIAQEIETNSVHPKKHPGIMSLKPIQLPPRLRDAMQIILEKYPTKDLEARSAKFLNHLWGRHPPQTDSVIQAKAAAIEKELLDAEYRSFEAKIKGRLMKRLRYVTYHWQPVEYDAFQGFIYMYSRLLFDYSALYRILHEIRMRDSSFSPVNMLDFGSGVGSSIWAVNAVWPKKKIQEHLCIDTSNDMNTIARLLLQGAQEYAEPCFPGVYFRQSLSATSTNTYDIVICAFTLFEMPSQNERLKLLLNLWRKTDCYLVIVEQGTNAAFQLINEARQFILENSEMLSADERQSLKGHVFSPCPHDLKCPRTDASPCNTQVNSYDWKSEKQVSDLISIICTLYISDPQWPRLVRSCTKSNKCIHCRLCTSEGHLQYSIITSRRQGKALYRVARASDWSDLLPVRDRESTDGDR